MPVLRNSFLLDSRLALQFILRAFEEGFNHFSNPFLQFRADSSLTNQGREAVQISGMRPAQLHVLRNLYQYIMTTHFKSRRVTEIVFHLSAGRRPFQPFGSILSLTHGEACLHGTNYRYFGSNQPAHNAAAFFADSLDARHQVGEVLQFAKKLARALQSCFQFQLPSVGSFDSKHFLSLTRVLWLWMRCADGLLHPNTPERP